jgi:tetratricopeptide (TPR) repeat protein
MTIFFLFLSVTTIARNHQWRDAITFYNQTLEYAPDSYRVNNNLGMAYADAGDHQKAVESYQRAIAIDPSVKVAYHNLGNAYKDLGQTELAITNFELALSKDYNFFYSYNAIASLFLEKNQPAEAITELKKLQALYPENSYTANLIKQIQDYYKIK